MACNRIDSFRNHFRTLFALGAASGYTDGQLLEQFTTRRGEAAELAFAALVERHGPMVLIACREILGDEHEAQDAFQATFLILVRKAGSLWIRDSIGPWLHRVACRVAVRARIGADRHRAVERQAAEATARSTARSPHDEEWAGLHEEIDRLPERYRGPIVLCYLEDLTYEQAAQRLGCPVGTVKSRLARGRELLRRRLGHGDRPGPTPTAWGAVPAALAMRTFRAAVGASPGVSMRVRVLIEGGSRAMFIMKWRSAALTLAAVAGISAGAAVMGQQELGGRRADPRERAAAPREAVGSSASGRAGQASVEDDLGASAPAVADLERRLRALEERLEGLTRACEDRRGAQAR